MAASSFTVNLLNAHSAVRLREPREFSEADEAISFARSIPIGANEQVRVTCRATPDEIQKIKAAGLTVAT